MAESNATQVILTDDGIKIINAQNTADSAASQAENANSATLIAQSTANAAKSAADSTYDYASSEMAVHSMATAKAQSAADNAFSQAQTVFSQADSEIAVQSTATAKAQSTADNAFSQATTAIDNGQAVSQAVTALKDGSTLTIAELGNGLATKVANSDYASYQTQTASQIASKVDNGAFSAYQTQTADLIAQKVATKDFSAYQATTAKAIESKVESKDFNTYKTQTDSAIDDKVSSSEYASDKTQTASEIANRVSNSAFSTYQTQTASQIGQMVTNGAFSAYSQATAELISAKVATSDFSSYKDQTAKSIDSKVASSAFDSYKKQTADAISSKVSSTDFNNLTISNRNLALGTATAFKMTGNNSTNNVKTMYSLSSTIAKGTTVTVSFDITSTNSTGTYSVEFVKSSWQYISGTLSLASGTQHHSYTLTTNADFSDGIQIRLDNSTSTVTVSNFIISESSKEVSWTPAPEDQATQSQFTQLSNDMNLRVKKGDLVDEINLQAGNTLISSSGQLTLSGKNIYFDTVNPVIIPSANITGTLTGKNINLDINGLINSPYTGIQQTADQFYHPWKLNTGQLTIGQGYITSVSSGTRSINGVPKQFNSLQGTLSASYLKFTNDYGARTYIDADMFTYSNQTNDTAIVAISASGVGINMGTMSAPALTISNGYIDASSSSSYGIFGAITLGYTAHTINSDSSLFFESGYGSGNPGINIWAKGFQSLSSRLSTKRQARLLDDEHSNSLLLGADTATFQYNQDTNADNSNEGVIIDDVNTVKQYNLPDELITRDGKAPTDLMSFIARVISQNKYQARLIENLQIRLREVEIKNE
ncbi:hypothetical protein EFO98_06915 [Lactiplantibacillus argentoratensis]|uniref:hypothetical protein n=1 Tax=Lactiplantibacillus argentoratensis TaxID=271881 RepID=UPI0021A9A92C|nr:hypothetical protein [Lactiplantibacillus argentoratensis]MCT4443489.1 hypothetical protein [Lactiplantibacillus argentoratensis]